MPKTVNIVLAVGALAVPPSWAQPAKPNSAEYLCFKGLPAEEVASTLKDDEGFTPLFNGKDWTGLWQDCQSVHSNDKVNGAIWMIDTANAAIFSTQRGASTGGLLLTKKKYGNYEVQFDIWPSFGNDAGFFNRTTANGTCYQTVMDYILGASFLGTYPEAGYQGSHDFRPSIFTSPTDPKQMSTTGNDNINNPSFGGSGGWTKWTANKTKAPWLGLPTATDLGCAATGCVAADWNRLWSFDGWNQVRIKFYGGTAAGTGKIHMQSFFRKLGATQWVPVWADSIAKIDPPSYIGLQVHGGGRFGGANGNWYKNYRLRELDNEGKPVNQGTPVVAANVKTQRNAAAPEYSLTAAFGVLAGTIDADHTITVRDMTGRELERFSGHAGSVNYAFTSESYGLLMLDIKTAKGAAHQRVSRI
ncbi:MAG TPA: family 16 glycoside hydrolase [Fibrobacteria bacterium]|nr:family 16 glycoside hydrolase [Fibrobacteria bacterium]